ncbi:MAG: hypothetical protein ACYSWU_16640, partial [Planctomycetota bacterium]
GGGVIRKVIRRAALVILSLAALATLAVGTASFLNVLRWDRTQTDRECLGVQISRGRLLLCRWELMGDVELGKEHLNPKPRWGYIAASPMNALRWWEFRKATSTYGKSFAIVLSPRPFRSHEMRCSIAGFPLWAPFVFFAAWPTIAAIRFVHGPLRRRRRRRNGLCLKCGYNLTGLVEPRCPECGTATSRLTGDS